MSTRRTHLVSFADGAFAKRRQAFKKEALESSFFDSVTVYNLDSLPIFVKVSHADYMTKTSRGFGYWIWKPIVILEVLKNASADDCIVYMDAGFSINTEGNLRFQEYLELTRESVEKMLSFNNVFTEAHWTKQDCAFEVGVDRQSSIMKTSQLGSGMIYLQKTSSNIDLLKEWYHIATKDNYHFSDDSPSKIENHPNFREHRHDQSISSLLRKLRGTEITHYEVQDYQGRFKEMKGDLPAWATRSRE